MNSRGLQSYPATVALAIVCSAVYLAAVAGADLSPLAMPASPAALAARPWAPLTSIFAHSYPIHLAANLAVIIFAGSLLERRTSSLRLLLVYLLSGIAGALLFTLVCAFAGTTDASLSGASAAALGICAALLARSRRVFSSPVTVTALALAAYMVIAGLFSGNPGGSIAHLGGIAVGWLIGRRCRPVRPVPDTAVIDKAMRTGFDSLSDDERRRLINQSINQ